MASTARQVIDLAVHIVLEMPDNPQGRVSQAKEAARRWLDTLGASIGRFGLIAAGGYAFGPIGAAAGALLGGFLFGSSGPKIEGPRLGDLDVSFSTYGGVIPVGFGVQKVRAR